MTRTRSTGFRIALLLLFVVLPLLELFVLIQVGQVVGAWWTIGLLVLAAIIGSWLIRREGVRAWRALTRKLREGGLPGRELTDAALIVFGGSLMLAPGFITDALGLACALPLTRPIFRQALLGLVSRRLVVTSDPGGFLGFGGPPRGGRPGSADDERRGPAPGAGPDDVVRGDVVDESDED